MTVKELIEKLQKMPQDMRVGNEWGDDLVVVRESRLNGEPYVEISDEEED